MLSKIVQQYRLFQIQRLPHLIRSTATNTKDTYHTVKFDSALAAYGYKSKSELFRGWFVFKLCCYSTLVNNLFQLFFITRRILGQALFEHIMRSTLYGHFVAGTSKDELKPIVKRLYQHRVKLIFDYCMESDVVTKTNRNVHGSLFTESNENIYDDNMVKALMNVQTASELCGPSAITAIKITAFVPPDILQKLNQNLEEQDSSSSKLSILQFLSNSSSAWSQNEITEVEKLIQRIHRIVREVKAHKGRIFIDAEQSYFQTAIHKLVLELQEFYNQDDLVVYNTYQCYRTLTLNLLRQDLARAKRNNFYIGVKLVRGAYMDLERKRSLDYKTTDPIHPNFEATTESYHRAFAEALEYAKQTTKNIHVFVASHNENTVQYALKTMDSMGVKRDDGIVSFATLFGMCDYLTFPLAAVGYDAYKLTPYGPVHRLLPYLTRRAQENRAIFAKAEKDRQLHYEALRSRLFQ